MMKFSLSRSLWQATSAGGLSRRRLLDGLHLEQQRLELGRHGGVVVPGDLGVAAQHVEDLDLVLEDGLLVEHLDRLDRLLDALRVPGHRLRVHDLALDEIDDQGALGVDLVGHRGPHTGLGDLDHAVALDLAVDEHVGALPGDAHHVLAAARIAGAVVHPDDVVVVGDAAAQLFPADVLVFPVRDARDGFVGAKV